MSELPITPFAPFAGLEPLGSADAGMCVDGVCSVPESGSAAESADLVPTDSAT